MGTTPKPVPISGGREIEVAEDGRTDRIRIRRSLTHSLKLSIVVAASEGRVARASDLGLVVGGRGLEEE